jgi:hypothetical protein
MQPLLSSALRVLLHMLGLNQSSIVLQSLFATQRALVTKVGLEKKHIILGKKTFEDGCLKLAFQ